MKKHTLIMYETPYDNEIKEGELKVIYDKQTGLIKDILKKKLGKLASIISKEPKILSKKLSKKSETPVNNIIEEIINKLDKE